MPKYISSKPLRGVGVYFIFFFNLHLSNIILYCWPIKSLIFRVVPVYSSVPVTKVSSASKTCLGFLRKISLNYRSNSYQDNQGTKI